MSGSASSAAPTAWAVDSRSLSPAWKTRSIRAILSDRRQTTNDSRSKSPRPFDVPFPVLAFGPESRSEAWKRG